MINARNAGVWPRVVKNRKSLNIRGINSWLRLGRIRRILKVDVQEEQGHKEAFIR
jgi:hypothetical protein